MNTSKQIAAGISAEMARRGHSKRELADVWGVTQQTVYSKLATGMLTTDEVDKVAQFLNISFVDLVKASLMLADSRMGVAA